MSGHIVLLGDSILDNASYVPGGPSVTGHVQRLLPKGWKVTMIAVDGATVSNVQHQIENIPDDATHLVLSAGGNDALWTAGSLFSGDCTDIGDALAKLSAACREFSRAYRHLVDEIRTLQRHLSICTVYDSVPGLSEAEKAGLCVFNDVITRTAFAVGATLIDLRNICNEASDYAELSPIEPSVSGGGKIARAIMRAVSQVAGSSRPIA